MNLYTDPTVSFIMRNLAAGLAEFNAKTDTALSQATQIGALPPAQPAQPGAAISVVPVPGCVNSTGDA